MAEGERNWVEVQDMYFGNAVYPPGARYRVADDGIVQLQVEIPLQTRTKTLNEHSQAYEIQSSAALDEVLGELHDISVCSIIAGGLIKNQWLLGWRDLDDEGMKNYALDKDRARSWCTVIPWPDFVVEGK